MAPPNIYAQGLDMDRLSPRNIFSKGSGTIYTSPYSPQSFRRGKTSSGIEPFGTATMGSATSQALGTTRPPGTSGQAAKKKLIGKDFTPAIGCRVVLTEEAHDYLMHHFGKDVSEGRTGIISVVYEGYCWVKWDNGAGNWYNTGRHGRYELILRQDARELIPAPGPAARRK
mmetsp:Transcript_87749/g.233535  ORF Transcript_87749/g.233535 Transcript_87749/m.233535 type:complete len:171 (+) Transcript_87749:2-514(+)